MTKTQISLVPSPLSISPQGAGAKTPSSVAGAVLSDGLVIVHPVELAREARWFRGVLEAGTGWTISTAEAAGPKQAGIELRLGDLSDLSGRLASLLPAATRHESYRLEAAGGKVVITAPGAAGAFYGLQTLRQMLPDSVFRRASHSEPIHLPTVEIVDAPRLSWRGVHLDVSRHFMPKTFVLKLIDLIALHKCNVLHLHLTDDQGWRIQIERYPRLTEIGAWRRRVLRRPRRVGSLRREAARRLLHPRRPPGDR